MLAPSLEKVPLGSRPTALILSPGASLGSWQAGVMSAFIESGLEFHSVLGTSIGAINGAAYFQGIDSKLKEMWRDMPAGAFMRFSPRLGPPSLYSLENVRRTLNGLIDEELCRRRRRCWFYAVSVDISVSGVRQAAYSPEEGGPWDGPLLDHVLGSVAVPFVFPPAEVPAGNGSPARTLVDGGLTSYARLAPLVERGARDFLFINVVDAASRQAPCYSPRGFIRTLINQMLHAQVHNSLDTLRLLADEEGLRAFEFIPSEPLDMKVFTFDPAECREKFDRGTADARKHLSDPEAFRIL